MRWQLYLFYLTVSKEFEYYLPYVNAFSAISCFALMVVITFFAEKKLSRKVSILYILLSAAYLTFLFSVTLLGRLPESKSSLSTLFITYAQALSGDMGSQIGILFNIALFMPVGWIVSRYQTTKGCMVFLLVLPLVIELLQLITSRGVFEISDIINNFVGGLIGLGFASLIGMIIKFIKNKRKGGTVEHAE